MRSGEAFSFLLEVVGVAFQDSLSRSNAAARRGEFETVEVEVEKQKNLVSARGQLNVLQELWSGLVGEYKPGKRPKRTRRHTRTGKRLPRGVKTSQKAFVLPILTALEQLEGNGRMAEVLDIVGRLVSDTLNKHDLSQLKNGLIRWRNTAQWARQQMKGEGLLADDSPRGVWEITERGRVFLREHAEKQMLLSRESAGVEEGDV